MFWDFSIDYLQPNQALFQKSNSKNKEKNSLETHSRKRCLLFASKI
jgi:hypothetical protein